MAYRKEFDPDRAEAFELYGGDHILYFDEESHRYEYEEQETLSPSKVVKILDKPALLFWAVNCSIDYLRKLLKPGQKYDEVFYNNAFAQAAKARFTVSKQATDIGTMVHAFIEEYILAIFDGKVPVIYDPEVVEKDELELNEDDYALALPFNKEARSALKAFQEWISVHHLVYLTTEVKVLSIKHRYAGTTDLEAILDGKLVLIDFKTSKAIYSEYWLQAAAYAKAREEEFEYLRTNHPEAFQELVDQGYPVNSRGKIQFDDIAILRVPKDDGTFEVETAKERGSTIANYFKRFKSALDLYIWQGEEEERTKAKKARLRDAKKAARAAERERKKEEAKAKKALAKKEKAAKKTTTKKRRKKVVETVEEETPKPRRRKRRRNPDAKPRRRRKKRRSPVKTNVQDA